MIAPEMEEVRAGVEGILAATISKGEKDTTEKAVVTGPRARIVGADDQLRINQNRHLMESLRDLHEARIVAKGVGTHLGALVTVAGIGMLSVQEGADGRGVPVRAETEARS